MQITINGEKKQFTDGLSLATLVDQLGMKSERLAIELNRNIIPRTAWPETPLKNEDVLEIVHFVGGGLRTT